MHKTTKLTNITKEIRQQVLRRDQFSCVVCGSHSTLTMAHVFYSRAHAGMGVKENLATLCIKCHHGFDNGLDKEHYAIKARLFEYMYRQYPDLDISKLKIGGNK